jgi:hypothetical protein
MEQEGFYTIEIDIKNEKRNKICNFYDIYCKKPLTTITKSTCGRVITASMSVLIGIIVYITSHYAGTPIFSSVCNK